MIDFATIKSLLWTFAPIIISYGLSYYRSLRDQSRANLPSRRLLPQHIGNCCTILLAVSIIAVIKSLPLFAPENIITATASRLQTPSDVLWRRVAALRPDNALTPQDEALRARLMSLDGRCLMLAYGPDALASCPYCRSDEPSTFFVYAIPSIVLPHILNIAVLGLCTSAGFAGKEGSRWRGPAALSGFVLPALELYAFHYYDWRANGRVGRPDQLTFFYWNMRVARLWAIALLDAAFAGLLWLSATNRLFATPYSVNERVEDVGRHMESTAAKLSALGIVRNAALRSEDLTTKSGRYWRQDGEVMDEVMKEDEVAKTVRRALADGRLDMQRIDLEAKMYAENFVGAQPSL